MNNLHFIEIVLLCSIIFYEKSHLIPYFLFPISGAPLQGSGFTYTGYQKQS